MKNNPWRMKSYRKLYKLARKYSFIYAWRSKVRGRYAE